MAREPAAIRHKNPGAMWPGKIASKWGSTGWVYLNDGTGQGGNGQGNKIATFSNWVDGICAQLDLWRSSLHYKNKPFHQAIRTWSGGNNVESYINYVLVRIPGMTRDTVMNDAFWRSPNGIRFLKVQAGHEAGKPIPASDADYREAQRRVFKGVVPTPSPAPQPGSGGPLAAPLVLAVMALAGGGVFLWQWLKRKWRREALPAPSQSATPVQPPEQTTTPVPEDLPSSPESSSPENTGIPTQPSDPQPTVQVQEPVSSEAPKGGDEQRTPQEETNRDGGKVEGETKEALDKVL